MKRLTAVRLNQSLSQAKLARMAELNQSTLSRIETGFSKAYPGELRRICEVLGWTGDPQELLDDVEGEGGPGGLATR